MIHFIALLVGGLVACTPVPIPPPPAPPPDMATCAASVVPTQESMCEDMFTPEGYACFACSVSAECLDAADQVYCVVACAQSSRCSRLVPDDPASVKRAQTARKRISKRVKKR